jgi:hypothetical protein
MIEISQLRTHVIATQRFGRVGSPQPRKPNPNQLLQRTALTLTLVLLVVGAILIGVIQARAYDDGAFGALLRASGWGEIFPGETTLEEAQALLTQHGWVDEVQVSVDKLSWWWNGDQPAFLDASGRTFNGRISFGPVDGVETVTSVVMQTHIPFGDVVLTLGQPDRMVLFETEARGRGDSRPVWAHVAIYDRRDLHVFTLLDCPATPEQFWAAPAQISFGDPQLSFEGTRHNIDTYRTPVEFFGANASACSAA